jgi:hypothetical protein
MLQNISVLYAVSSISYMADEHAKRKGTRVEL